jgi:glutamate racemase
MKEASIGIFDSGFGGLTVMRAIRAALPNENIIYFGDTARLPYGNKSADTILSYSRECSSFLIDQGIKILVIACHTASTNALVELQQLFSIPVVGVTPAAVEETIKRSKNGKIAILGTRATISSNYCQQQILARLPHAEISAISCPLFVPLVEEGYIEHPMAEIAAHEYLRPLRDKEIDTVLLGCTHYPLLQTSIQKALGSDIALIDPAHCCASETYEILSRNNLLSTREEIPTYQFYVSDDPEKFRLLGKTFLSYPIEHVHSKPL